jgi:hypothetical protein
VVAWNESLIEKHYQVFGVDEPWEIRQRLYYSVTDNVEDHYQLGHPMNAGEHGANAPLMGPSIL